MPTTREYQEMLAGGCPWCGEALVLKIGKYGEFIACQNWCGFTKSVPGRSNYPPFTKGVACRYKTCDGSGLLPFLKNGAIVPHIHLYCDCHPDYGLGVREYYRDTQPYDFDFTCSPDFRSFYEVESGRLDSQQAEPITTNDPTPVVDVSDLTMRISSLEKVLPRIYSQLPKRRAKGKY